MFAFVNANLIDGTGAPARSRQRVLIDGSEIIAIGRRIDIPEGAEVCDLQGKTLMPGLIDSHIHFGNGYRKGIAGAEETDDYRDLRNNCLAYGVTAVRSGGDYIHDVVRVRDQVNSGQLRGPRMVVCGPHIMDPGSHPASTMWGNDAGTLSNCGLYPKTPSEGRDMVRMLRDIGVDYIKIILSEGHLSFYPEKLPCIADEIVEAVCDESQKAGLRTAAHVETLEQALKFTAYGGNEVHHLMMTGSKKSELPQYIPLFQKMCKNNVGLVPTMVIPRRNEMKRVAKGVNESSISHMAEVIRMAYDFGVLLGCGTDAGAPITPWGPSLHGELDEYVDSVGMSPLEAIRCATSTNAKLMGFEGTLGQIRAGAYADLIVLEADPSHDIYNTRTVCMTMRDGKLVWDKTAEPPEDQRLNPRRSWPRW